MKAMMILWLALVPGAEPEAAQREGRIVRELVEVATDKRASSWARLEALRTLGKLGPTAKSAAIPLGDHLRGTNEGNRRRCKRRLSRRSGRSVPPRGRLCPD